MNYATTSKFELNLSDPMVPIPFATDLASKNKMAAIVFYDPSLIVPLVQQRFSSHSRWKLILALDFPSGGKYVLEKFKHLPKDFDMSNVDGFDILLSSRTYTNTPPNEIEVRNEVEIIRNFVHGYNKQTEVRFVIDALSRPTNLVESALKAFKKNPPAFIRLDHNIEMPEGRANVETIGKAIDFVRKYSPSPIKVSTNVSLDIMKAFPNVPRFDVNVKQAQRIIHELDHPVEVVAAAPEAAKTSPTAELTPIDVAVK